MEVAENIDCIGELYFYNATTPKEVVLTSKSEWYTVTGLSEGTSRDLIESGTAGTFTIVYDGTYLFTGAATIFPSAGCLITFGLHINDILQTNIITALSFKNNQDTNTFSGSGVLKLKTGDVVKVKAMSDTDLVTLTLTNMNLRLHRTDRRA